MEPNYAVILTDEYPRLDGVWWDLSATPPNAELHRPTDSGWVVFHVTDQFEYRESDGAVAQVYRRGTSPLPRSASGGGV